MEILFCTTGSGRTEDGGAIHGDRAPPNSNSSPCSSWRPDSVPRGAQHSLGEVGQVLGDLGDEGEGAGGAVVRVLLQQVEERGRHDGGAEEAQEQGGTDEPLADVRPAAAAALLPPRGKHLFQLPWEDTEGTEDGEPVIGQGAGAGGCTAGTQVWA